MTTVSTYAKFIVAFVGFLLTTAITLNWGFNFPSWVPALSSLLTAVGVYLWPNKPYVQVDGDNGLDNAEVGDSAGPTEGL